MRSLALRGAFLTALMFMSLNAAIAVEAVSQGDPAASSRTPASSSTSASQKTSQVDKTESLTVDTDVQPFQVAMVNGDYHKYEALNWQNRGYSGGIKDFSMRYKSGDDVTIDVDGGGIMGNGDYRGSYAITQKDEGYLKFDFRQFRKYYDTYGGIWEGHTDSLSRDLYLDIGHFGVEAGITQPDLPSISVYYDHDYKIGSKSMLNWDVSTVDGATKKISPSWEEIDETTDTFGIKADYEERGYHFTGDQKFEIAKWKTRGYEQRLNDGTYISSTPGAGGVRDTNNQTDQRRQDQVQETVSMMTTLGADKWYWNDKVFTSSAYRFEHLKNSDRQNVQEFNKNGTLSIGTATSATAANLNKPDGSAHNDVNLNSWVLNMMVSPWNWLSGTGGLKAEVYNRDATSFYPNDTAAPNGGSYIDNVGKTITSSDTYKLAESFGLRFKAIPRTAVYSDLSLEQSQNALRVDRTGYGVTAAASASDNQTRNAIIDEPVVNWVIGADFQPVRMLNLTSQVRFRDKHMDIHDNPWRVTAFNGQVFLQKLHTRDYGFTQRATARLCNWAQTSFRYLFDNTDYTAKANDASQPTDTDEKANTISHNFIYDLSVYPLSNLSMTGSFSQLYSQTKTVLASGGSGNYLKPFQSDSSSWMLATDYQPLKKLHLDNTLFYTLANNYGDNQNTSLVNYAAAFTQLGVTVGCKWEISKDLSLRPQYAFQRYLPNENSGVGAAYDAQIVSLSLKANWG